MIKYIKILIIFSLSFLPAFSQVNEFDSLMNSQMEENTHYAIATFKSTRIINNQSVKLVDKKDLNLVISHTFGKITEGAYDLFGLDYSTSHFHFEYGLLDWMTIGIGRATYQKSFDGYLKIRFIRQSTGKKSFPLTITYLNSSYINTVKWSEDDKSHYFSSRLMFLHQVQIARKINENISLQLSPTFIHRNLVDRIEDNNDVYSLGFGGRYKLTNRFSLNFDYQYIINRNEISVKEHKNPLSIGFDIETGSHIFQIFVSNNSTISESHNIINTSDDWLKGDLHIGFNITRIFTLKKQKETTNEEFDF